MAEMPKFPRIKGNWSMNMMATLGFRLEVEIWPFHAFGDITTVFLDPDFL